ncbi:DnaB-like helicase C-terminal domain-containing protein, partial [Pseudomonas aeruginosa]
EGVGATAAALVDLSTVAGNKISNPPWVKFQSAGWVNFPSAPTGAIEQDADIIMFVYRDEVYNPDTEFKGVAELILGKQRNGAIGTVRTAFIGKETRFAPLAPESFRSFD